MSLTLLRPLPHSYSSLSIHAFLDELTDFYLKSILECNELWVNKFETIQTHTQREREKEREREREGERERETDRQTDRQRNPFNVLCFRLSGICIKSELYLFR